MWALYSKPCVSSIGLLFLPPQASDSPAGTGTAQAFKRQVMIHLDSLYLKRNPFLHQLQRSTCRQPQGGQAAEGEALTPFLLHPLHFLQFPKGLSTCNIHLPSGVSALISGAHVPS